MEEKKFDVKSIIGFVLIFGILIFMFYQNQPTPEELEAQKAKQEQVEAQNKAAETIKETPVAKPSMNVQDSTSVAGYKNAVGAFGFNTPSDATTVLENDLVVLKVSNKGGQIVEAKMKNFVTYDSIPVYLVKDGNSSFDIMFKTNENRSLNTKDLYFEPTLTNNGDMQILSMKAKVSPSQFLEYRYEMKPNDYLVDFIVRSQGLNGIINPSGAINLKWNVRL